MTTRLASLLRMLRGDEKQGDFTRRIGMDQANYAAFESRTRPIIPGDKVLAKILRGHGLEPGTERWNWIVDAATVLRGKVPKDVLEHPAGCTALLETFKRIRSGEMQVPVMNEDPTIFDMNDDLDRIIVTALIMKGADSDDEAS